MKDFIEVYDEHGRVLILNRYHISSMVTYNSDIDMSVLRLSNGDTHYVKDTLAQIKGKLNAGK